ncbi:MAG: hypothetical protein AAGF33_09605 [Pseudomonadota bacterium]
MQAIQESKNITRVVEAGGGSDEFMGSVVDWSLERLPQTEREAIFETRNQIAGTVGLYIEPGSKRLAEYADLLKSEAQIGFQLPEDEEVDHVAVESISIGGSYSKVIGYRGLPFVWNSAAAVFSSGSFDSFRAERPVRTVSITPSSLTGFVGQWNNLAAIDTLTIFTNVDFENAQLAFHSLNQYEPDLSPLCSKSMPVSGFFEITSLEPGPGDDRKWVGDIYSRSLIPCPDKLFSDVPNEVQFLGVTLTSFIVAGTESQRFSRGSAVFLVPLKHKEVQIRPVELIVDASQLVGETRLGFFGESFPALSELSLQLDGMGINGLSVETRNTERTSSELTVFLQELDALVAGEIDIFGVAVPRRLVETWGLLLLSVQLLHMAVHVRALTRISGNESVDEAFWIGSFTTDRLAFSLALASCSGLPVALALYISATAVSSFEGQGLAFSLFSGAICMLLATFLFLEMLKMKAKRAV